MATRFVFGPQSAEFPASSFPQLAQVNTRPALAFDAAVDEACYWTAIAPTGFSGALTVVVHYIMASATAGAVVFQAALEAVTPGDALDLDAAASFDTANNGNGNVPGTAGYMQSITISLANADSIAAGDLFRLSLSRDADNAGDTAAGDCFVLAIELRDSA
jgi:hypothetical protein